MPADYFLFFDGLDPSGNDAPWVSGGAAAGTRELTGTSGANSGRPDPQEITR